MIFSLTASALIKPVLVKNENIIDEKTTIKHWLLLLPAEVKTIAKS